MLPAEPGVAALRRPHAFTVAALGVGAVAVVLAALPYKVFDLDRYFVPKELVLHLTAVLGGLGALAAMGRAGAGGRRSTMTVTRVDTLLLCFVVLSAASALTAANGWLAGRAVAVTASGAVLFWVAQALARAGRARPVLAILGAAVTVAAITSLLQAYGVETDLFSLNRSPGGTLGNRNFVAHLGAIGAPVLIVAALRARRLLTLTAAAAAIAVVSAALVLSRSRGAWVATALALLAILPSMWRARQLARQRALESTRAPRARQVEQDGGIPGGAAAIVRRAAVIAAAAVAGICAAVAVPNTLNWRSASPYLDSMLGVTNYRAGSGRGRLVQYANTARMAASHPLLGVGPGNWAVAYPHLVPRSDPSLDPDDGMTANPWPSSDWAAFLSERGAPATVCLGLMLLGLVVAAGRVARGAAEDGRWDRLVLALGLTATVVAVVAVGAFDAVLLLPAPALIAWPILGALMGTLVPPLAARVTIPLSGLARGVLVVALLGVGGVAVLRSASQIVSMALYTSAPRAGATDRTLELASRADPGSYRIHLRLAEAYAHGRSCGRARAHAAAARALFPSAPQPKRLLAECGAGTPR